MRIKKVTVTIAIPAYNEERSIGVLLESLIRQKQHKVSIDEIVVLSDGSKDKTVDVCKLFDDKRIRVVNGTKRLGKSRRLNQIYRKFETDVLVVFDADVLPENDLVVERLVAPIARNKRVGVVGANAQPLDAETFVEKAINTMFFARDGFKYLDGDKHRVFGLWGCGMALTKNFARNLYLPVDVPEDSFIFFWALNSEFEFRYQDNAIVRFRSPQTIEDQVVQGKRFVLSADSLASYFDEAEIQKSYQVPLGYQIRSLVFQIVSNPLGYLLMKYMHLLVKRSRVQKFSPVWKQALSTKQIGVYS